MKRQTVFVLGMFFIGWGGAFALASEPSEPLPFALKVTKVPCDDAPVYMGGLTGMDFPFCGVKIGDEYWILLGNAGKGPSRWMGTNFVSATKQPDGRNENRKHVDRPYMLGGMWYNAAEKKLYAPMHCETHLGATGVAGGDRQIHLSTSTDKGATWKYEGPLVTRTGNDNPWRAVIDFPGAYWNGGNGDFYLFVDERGGYIYLYSNHYTWPKPDARDRVRIFLRHHVARCAIADKMAPGKWKKFYNGKWEEPGVGGKSSYVNGYCVMYNTYLKKYISFNYGSGISLCTDMDKQDWTPSFEIKPKELWGTSWDINTTWIGFGWGAWHVLNADRTDLHTGGQTLYWYKYWMDRKTECYRLDLGPGETATTGYHVQGGYGYAPTTYSPPFMLYGDIPFHESSDPIEGRRTRKVERGSPEVTASPGWSPVGVSSITNSSLELTFKGRDIYWRTARGPARGKADVFLDGVLQATVDTWASFDTQDMFAFIKTDLDPTNPHTIKVVVRGEKNARSTGTSIAHLSFEYAAESYRASYAFSRARGGNPWRYQERHGDKVADITVFQNGAWLGESDGGVGVDFLLPGIAQAQGERAWIAPHDGQVRVEGTASAVKGVARTILQNGRTIWPTSPGGDDKPLSHDLMLTVKQGDAISFAVGRPDVPPVLPRLDVLSNMGQVQRNKRGESALKIKDQTFERGLYCQAPSKVVVSLSGPGKTFSATVGIDAGAGASGSVVFSVLLDDKAVYTSDVLKGGMAGVPLAIELGGAREFTLVVGEAGDGRDSDQADWANAKVILADGKELYLGDLPIGATRWRTSDGPFIKVRPDRMESAVIWDPVVTYIEP